VCNATLLVSGITARYRFASVVSSGFSGTLLPLLWNLTKWWYCCLANTARNWISLAEPTELSRPYNYEKSNATLEGIHRDAGKGILWSSESSGMYCRVLNWLSTDVSEELSQYCVRLQAWQPGFDRWQRQRIFPLASVPRSAVRPTQPSIQWIPRSFPGVKARPGRDAGHSPPSSVKVKSTSYTSSLLVACMAIAGQLYFSFSNTNLMHDWGRTEKFLKSKQVKELT
jgi:hypothetical protein